MARSTTNRVGLIPISPTSFFRIRIRIGREGEGGRSMSIYLSHVTCKKEEKGGEVV